jgi:hypothetical protein
MIPVFTTDHGPFLALDAAREMMALIASWEPGGGLLLEETTYCGRTQSISAKQPVSSSQDRVKAAGAPAVKVAHKRRGKDAKIFILGCKMRCEGCRYESQKDARTSLELRKRKIWERWNPSAKETFQDVS